MQYHRGNGQRYNKEPLHLRREPNNAYDRNAIAVHTVPGGPYGGAKVGHAILDISPDASPHTSWTFCTPAHEGRPRHRRQVYLRHE